MCFSLAWIIQVLIWLIVVIGIIKLLELIVPWVLSQLGSAGNIIIAALRIVLWVVVAVMVVTFFGELISCLLGAGGGLSMPHLRG